MLRKKPLQNRSQSTLDTIFEATAQMIDSDGLDQLSTNKVAAKASFSVGTLYSYFPNKKAIIAALAAMGQNIALKQMEEFFSAAESNPMLKEIYPPDLIRTHIQTLLKTLNSDSVVTRVAFRLCWTVEQTDVTIAASKAVADRVMVFLQRINHPQVAQPTAAQLFILVRSMVGIIRYGVLEKTALWGTKQMENELVCLIWGLMRKDEEMEKLRSAD
jgi:AcrR family transcriptional regulator